MAQPCVPRLQAQLLLETMLQAHVPAWDVHYYFQLYFIGARPPLCAPKGLLSAAFVQSCLIGFRLLCEFIQCQAQALNPCQVIHHFSLNAIDRILLLACQIKA